VRERGGYELVVVPRLLFRCFNKVVFHRKSIVYFAVTRVSDAVCVQPYKVAILG